MVSPESDETELRQRLREHESTVTVLRRLLERIRVAGVKIRWMLLDRAFFSAAVMQFLQDQNVPFVMPVMLRGRLPKKGRPATGRDCGGSNDSRQAGIVTPSRV